MKNIKYKVLLMICVLVSCQEQEVSEIVSPGDNAIVSITLASPDLVVNEGENEEGDAEIVYTVKLDKMVDRAITITAHQTGGTATSDDYTIVDGVVAPYSKEAQVIIMLHKDIEPEAAETLTLQFETDLATSFLLNPSSVYPAATITINNYVSDDLEMSFAWAQDIEVGDEVVHTCDLVDFDIFIADAEGFDIDDPWATFNDAVMAATGDCPEVMTFSGLPDGSYIIFAELWVNELHTENVDTPMPITATFTRAGVFVDKVYVQDESQVINSNTPGVDDDAYDGEVIDVYVAEVTIAGGIYTIKGFDGNEVIKGKVGKGSKALRTPRPLSTLHNKR